MDILNTIKEIRNNLNISQSDMLPSMSKSTYSKIERGAVELKFDILLKICNRFDMTVQEFLEYSMIDEAIQFRKQLNECHKNLDDPVKKNLFLSKYYPGKNVTIESLSSKQLAYYSGITTVFYNLWKEIPVYSTSDIKKIIHHLTKKQFYSQYDYQILMNIILFLTKDETMSLLKVMYPIKNSKQRPYILKNLATRALLNRISTLIFKLNYEEALEIITFAEENIDFSEDYFLALSFEYHKNLVNRFILRNTLYIERARQVITMMRRISSPEVADTYELELNNLSDNPEYYLNEMISKYPRTPIE